MRCSSVLLACCAATIVLHGVACSQSTEDAVRGQLMSFVSVSSGYHFLYGGRSGVRSFDSENPPGGVSTSNADLFAKSPNVGLSVGVLGAGAGLFVGIHYTSYRLKSTIPGEDAFGHPITIVPSDRESPVYNLDLGLAYPLADVHRSRVLPLLVVSISSAADESFFQDRGRLFHLTFTVMTVIKMGTRPTDDKYLGVIPSVSYDLGRENKLPASLFVNIGVGWFMSRR